MSKMTIKVHEKSTDLVETAKQFQEALEYAYHNFNGKVFLDEMQSIANKERTYSDTASWEQKSVTPVINRLKEAMSAFSTTLHHSIDAL